MVKQLWIWIIEGLIRECLIEVPPYFTPTQFSALEIIAIIKQVMTGPRTWGPPSPSPTVLTRIEMTISSRPVGRFQGDSVLKIANGGRQIVVSHQNGLEIWDVTSERRMWRRRERILSMAADTGRSDGTSVTVALLSRDADTWVGLLKRTVSALIEHSIPKLDVVELDLSDTNAEEVASIPIPRFAQFKAPIMVGSLILVILARNPHSEVLLVNWRTEQGIILVFGGSRSLVLLAISVLPVIF